MNGVQGRSAIILTMITIGLILLIMAYLDIDSGKVCAGIFLIVVSAWLLGCGIYAQIKCMKSKGR